MKNQALSFVRSKVVNLPSLLLALLLVPLLARGTAMAQADFEKGYQAYQSFHGSDFDTINLANGNLILDIPLLSYPQRGSLPPIVISIRSNATTFQSTPPYLNGPLDTKQHEVSSGVIGSPWGQPHVSISPGGLSWREERLNSPLRTAAGSPVYLTRFVALDDSGATHSLGGNVANQTAGVIPDIRYSVDGSGLMLRPSDPRNGSVLVDRKGLIGGLIDTNGNAIALNGPCARPPGTGDSFNASLASWQGFAHGTASAVSLTDTIGRTFPNPSYLPPAVPYTCLVDLYASYAPAHADPSGCETWNFPGEGNSTVPLIFCYQQIDIAGAVIPTPISVGTTAPNGGTNTYACSPAISGNGNNISCETINETWTALTSVTLPNQTKWIFTYDNYGQVASLTMPTGATISYTYATRLACGNPPGEIPATGIATWPYSNLMSSRMVTQRVLDVRDGLPVRTWKYASTVGSGWGGSPNAGSVTVTDPQGNDTVHNFNLQGESVCGPFETSTASYQGAAAKGALLKSSSTIYSNTGTDSANPTNFSNYSPVGVLPATVTTTLPTPTGSVTSTSTSAYDTFGTYQDYIGKTHPFSFGLLLSSTDADWSTTSSAGPVLGTTRHTYLWQDNFAYYKANLIDLLCLETSFAGLSQGAQTTCTPPSPLAGQVAQSSYSYDESAYSDAGLLGNVTTISHWLQGGAPVSSHMAYTSAAMGMPVSKIDANGNPTNMIYDATGLFLKEVDHPSTTTNGVTIAHRDLTNYDAQTGLLMSTTDDNSQVTRYKYDSMRRLLRITYPDNAWAAYTFNDSAPSPSFYFTKSISPTQTYSASGLADGLGRMVQTKILSATEGQIIKDTVYDSLGRVASVSNPYRSTSDPTYGITSWLYDGIGRKLYQCQQDNAGGVQPACVPQHSYLQWAYLGNVTVSYDENRNAWTRAVDARGRLNQVIEPGGRNTTYAYDALNNLVCVDQWGKVVAGARCTSPLKRIFSYDSLSRLITSSNPETGTICYGQGDSSNCSNGYDPVGNLLHKTDARGVPTDYTYDALYRLTSKFYHAQTPSSYYQYDASALAGAQANMIGRLATSYTVSPGRGHNQYHLQLILSRRDILAYDPMGRILSEQQCTYANCSNGTPYNPTYDYDLAGALIHYTNGIGTIAFTNCYDSASRLLFVASVTTSCAAASYPAQNGLFTASTYTPAGALVTAAFGTGLTLTRTYDTRLRLTLERDFGQSQGNATPASATLNIQHVDSQRLLRVQP